MYDYKQYFEELVQLYQTAIIKINITADSTIKSLNSSTCFGFTEASYENDQVKSIVIYIDESLNWGNKIRVLFHEYGHALHYMSVDPKVAQEKISNSDLAWITETEYNAIQHEITCSKQIYIDGDKSFLKDTMTIISDRQTNYNRGYNEAVQKIVQEDLWQTCMKLTEV